ncbi:MAG: D-alanine--D-alanine ligase [Bacteroidales bacterium]|nr:D-alanine--D-alanine ligase [Bacteroidales bacterium]
MKQNIALVMGGYSGEHDISIASGNQVFGQLDHSKYNVYKIIVEREGWQWQSGEWGAGGVWVDGERKAVDKTDFSVEDRCGKVHFDLAFIIIHGNPGENGVLQGYFDMLGIRYTTCGFYTSALTFNKGYCNPVVKSFGVVKVARSVLLYKEPAERKLDELMGDMGYPVFVKPAAGGSSVATTKVKSREQLLPAIREALTEDRQVLVEEAIEGREFDCGVFRTADGKKLVFPITEIIPKGGHEFFDYEAKYQGFSDEVTPAVVDEAIADHIQKVSSRLYDLLGCAGIVRFDYIYSTREQELYFLEVNTIPGQSAESIVPKQARAMGISPAELYEMSIQAALRG